MANTHSLELEASSSQMAFITDDAQTGLDLSPTFTIQFWLKLESGSTYQGLVNKDDDTQASTRNYGVLLFNDNKIYAIVGDGSGQYDFFASSTAVTIGTWEHWAITCDVGNVAATTFEFFKNGSSLGHGTQQVGNNISAMANSSAKFIIGGRQDLETLYDIPLDGKIDDVRVYNTIRTEAQIAADMSQEAVGDEAGLVGYWKFNNDFADATTNNNDLTAIGSPVFSTDVPFGPYTSPLPAFRRPY